MKEKIKKILVILLILLPLIAYDIYLGSGVIFFKLPIFYPEIIKDRWHQLIYFWIGLGLFFYLCFSGTILLATIFSITKKPISLFKKIFNIAFLIGYSLLLFWLACTLVEILGIIYIPNPKI